MRQVHHFCSRKCFCDNIFFFSSNISVEHHSTNIIRNWLLCLWKLHSKWLQCPQQGGTSSQWGNLQCRHWTALPWIRLSTVPGTSTVWWPWTLELYLFGSISLCCHICLPFLEWRLHQVDSGLDYCNSVPGQVPGGWSCPQARSAHFSSQRESLSASPAATTAYSPRSLSLNLVLSPNHTCCFPGGLDMV